MTVALVYPPNTRFSTSNTEPSPTSSSSTITASTASMRPSRALTCFQRSVQSVPCKPICHASSSTSSLLASYTLSTILKLRDVPAGLSRMASASSPGAATAPHMDRALSSARERLVSGIHNASPAPPSAATSARCWVRISAALSSGRVTNLTLLKLRNRRNGTLEKTYRNRSHARV